MFRAVTSPDPHGSRWRLIITLALLAAAVTPIVAGVLATPPATTYTWLHATAPGDVGVYYSYVQQVSDGAVLLRDQFTSEAGQVGTFNVVWWLVGAFARLLRLSSEAAFHLVRLALLPLLVWAFGRVASLASDTRSRKLTLLLMFAGGLGAYAAPWYAASTYQAGGAGYRWPIDLWGVHTFPFLSALHSPHSVASWALFALAAWGGFRAVEFGERRPLVVALLATLLLANFHPYVVPIVVLLPLAYALLRRRFLGSWPRAPWAGVGLALAALPGVAYHLWLLASDPVVAQRASQNITLIPPLWFVLLGFGPLLPLALLGLWQRRRSYQPVEVWALSWLVLVFALVSLPTTIQSRLLQGVLLPLVLLATPVVLASYDHLARRWLGTTPAAAGLLLIPIFFTSPLYAIARDLAVVQAPPAGWYLPNDTVAALRWVAEHAPADAVVLAPSDLGLFVPRYARRITYVGHPHETLGYLQKAEATRAFYAGQLPNPQVWLASAGITHVVIQFEPGQPLPAWRGTEVARRGSWVVMVVAP